MRYEYFEEVMGDWAYKFRPFIESSECDSIYAYLKERSLQRRVILPSSDKTFRAFKETPLKELKTIFFLQDPYPWVMSGKNVADGIALSCSNTGFEQPSLSLFNDSLQKHTGKGKYFNRSVDLAYLCNQGVMLLNTSLTTELDRPNSHSKIRSLPNPRLWEPFMKFFFEEVLSQFSGLPLVFCGKESQYYMRYINPLQHYLFKVEHPASAAHSERAWNDEGVFKKIDYILKQNNNYQINWEKQNNFLT